MSYVNNVQLQVKFKGAGDFVRHEPRDDSNISSCLTSAVEIYKHLDKESIENGDCLIRVFDAVLQETGIFSNKYKYVDLWVNGEFTDAYKDYESWLCLRVKHRIVFQLRKDDGSLLEEYDMEFDSFGKMCDYIDEHLDKSNPNMGWCAYHHDGRSFWQKHNFKE